MLESPIIDITLPASRELLATLNAGDELRLFGPVYTMRDAGHLRTMEILERQGELPFELAGQALFYAGPTPAAAGRPLGAVGPTTASRMDFATPALLQAGIVATIGKGSRSEEVVRACSETGSVYLTAVGGAAAFLASKIKASELVAWEDLGTEALRRLELDGFPVFVAIDARGNLATDLPCAPTATEPDISPNHEGVFITFEGGEGVGKSTQIRLLAARLESAGIEVLHLREPGGTLIGEKIRVLLLDPQHNELSTMSELLLYEASRAQLVEEVIVPALRRGVTVLCDRYIDSTMAYQGYARGLDLELVRRANLLGSNGLIPDRTIVLELDVGLSLDKAVKDGADRLEAEGLEFHTLVHSGFAQIAALEPERVRRVQCQDHKLDTAEAIFAEVADLFPEVAVSDFCITPELLVSIKNANGKG